MGGVGIDRLEEWVSDQAPPEAGEEARSGLTPRQQRVATLLNQLTTTARSFLLYDARNEAVHHFIEALVSGLESFLSEEGPLALELQPFEISFDGRSVYCNRDRERSLAFRLYRDGVRALRIDPGFGWEELARLLEILSVRYTGIHQHEDDTVTLLWKAGFTHLDVVAVEGFVEVEEGGEPLEAAPHEAAGAETAEPAEVPDIPRPAVERLAEPAWREVPEAALHALRAEVTVVSLPAECVTLVERIRREMDDPEQAMTFAEVRHLFTEVRDFLLSDENLPQLVAYLQVLSGLARAPAPAFDPSRPSEAEEVLRGCGDQQALDRLLHSVSAQERHLKPAMLRVLDLACPDPVQETVDALHRERGPGARAAARQILEHYGDGHVEELRARFQQARGTAAADLLRVLARLGGLEVSEYVAAQCHHPDEEVREEALVQLERRPFARGALATVLDALPFASDAHRPRLLALLAGSADRRFVEPLLGLIASESPALEPADSAAIGVVVGRLGIDGVVERLVDWLRPAGRRGRRLNGTPSQSVAAAFALAEQPGDEVARLLRSALVAAGPECHDWIGRALSRHARRARQP